MDVFSGHGLAGGGAPYSGLVGSFMSADIMFATSTGYAWHPFGLGDFGADMTGCLNVETAGDKTFTLSSTMVKGDQTVSGLVTLECDAAPGNISVVLTSNKPTVAAPTVSNILIPFGSSTGAFTVSASAVTANTTVTIKATANGIARTRNLTVTP